MSVNDNDPDRTGEVGFTLLETLIAFLILSLLLLGANQTIALALKSRKTAIELEASDRLAETVLQDLQLRKAKGVMETKGKQDGLSWQMGAEDIAVPSTRIGTRIEKVTLDIFTAETARLIRRYTTFVARHPQEE